MSSDPPRRAKIVCTLGPASADAAMIEQLVRAGMDVARLNFSHGDHASQQRILDTVRATAKRLGRAVALIEFVASVCASIVPHFCIKLHAPRAPPLPPDTYFKALTSLKSNKIFFFVEF